MEAPRVNVYAFPHKGLRNGMAQVSMLAGNTNYSNEQELNELKSKTKEIVMLLDLHVHSEDDFVLPALEAKVPNSTEHNHEEHEELEKEIEDFSSLLETITTSSSPALGGAFYKAFTDFQSKYIAHMAMEEAEINPLIWSNFQDNELLEIHGAIMATLTPEQIISWFKYIVPALNPIERTIIMGGFQANAPEAFFAQVLEMLENEMSENSHSELVAMLTQEKV